MIEIHLIWAQDENGGIGVSGKLPWHITDDLKNFKKITLNSTIIMGRKTWDSLPIKPLPNRTNLVLSKSTKIKSITYNSYDKCMHFLEKNKINKVFIIGGRSIYSRFFNDAQYLHITNIHLNNKDINEYFPISIDSIKNNFIKQKVLELSKEATYTFWEKIKK